MLNIFYLYFQTEESSRRSNGKEKKKLRMLVKISERGFSAVVIEMHSMDIIL